MVTWSKPRFTRRGILSVLAVLALAFGLLQLIPIRVENPPVKQEPAWDSPRTLALARVACFDCHSNETETYWFEDVAPLSWWIKGHVDEGREKLNFSDCTQTSGGENEASETIREGSMPPNYYTWFGLHSDAKLTAKERQDLAAGLRATLSGWKCGKGD
jgi:mono/diheme cytochrome c family protein